MDSFKRFNKEQWYDKRRFYSSVKDGATGDNGEKLDGHISDKEYLTCNKIWNEFNMKNMGDYHDDYLKEDICYRLMFWIGLGYDVKNNWCKIRKTFRHWHVLIY